jgi:hypothetical protein
LRDSLADRWLRTGNVGRNPDSRNQHLAESLAAGGAVGLFPLSKERLFSNVISSSFIDEVAMRSRIGFLFVTLLALPLLGQAVAKQGSVADLKQSEFSSPLVIELPLARLKLEEPGNVYPFTDQEKFVCDGVSLPLILITKSTTWSKRVKLTIKATAYVRPSFDRKVAVLCSISDGTSVIGAVTELQISAKEKQYRSDSGSWELSKEAFDNLVKGDSPGRLKLVMTVTPDR